MISVGRSGSAAIADHAAAAAAMMKAVALFDIIFVVVVAVKAAAAAVASLFERPRRSGLVETVGGTGTCKTRRGIHASSRSVVVVFVRGRRGGIGKSTAAFLFGEATAASNGRKSIIICASS